MGRLKMIPFKIIDKFADKTIADRGERWTVPRKTVFDALLRLNKPVTAYQLCVPYMLKK
jgi:hypothetical protein